MTDFIAKCVAADHSGQLVNQGQRTFTVICLDRFACVTVGGHYYLKQLTHEEFEAAQKTYAEGPDDMTYAQALGLSKAGGE